MNKKEKINLLEKEIIELKRFIMSKELPFSYANFEGKEITKSVTLFDEDNNVIAIVGNKTKSIVFQTPIFKMIKHEDV